MVKSGNYLKSKPLRHSLEGGIDGVGQIANLTAFSLVLHVHFSNLILKGPDEGSKGRALQVGQAK